VISNSSRLWGTFTDLLVKVLTLQSQQTFMKFSKHTLLLTIIMGFCLELGSALAMLCSVYSGVKQLTNTAGNGLLLWHA